MDTLYCNICKRIYKSANAYNIHLSRRAHLKNLVKFETLYSKNPTSVNYHMWCKTRDESNAMRDSNPPQSQ